MFETINGISVYNATMTGTPSNLALVVMNQAQDYLCMEKAWRDLRIKQQFELDSERKLTLPEDFGCVINVYSYPGNTGIPQYWYYLNDNDIAKRYEEEVTEDDEGNFTRKFVFPTNTPISGDPWVTYSKVRPNFTAADVASETKKSFFPINIMMVTAKLIFQDYYGVPAKQDPNWIRTRVEEEIKKLEGYAYNNNVSMDKAIKDRNGSPVFIGGLTIKRGRSMRRPSPYKNSTLITGGTY